MQEEETRLQKNKINLLVGDEPGVPSQLLFEFRQRHPRYAPVVEDRLDELGDALELALGTLPARDQQPHLGAAKVLGELPGLGEDPGLARAVVCFVSFCCFYSKRERKGT